MKKNMLQEQDQMLQEKEAMLVELQEIEKECKNVRIYPTQGNLHTKGKKKKNSCYCVTRCL